MQHARTKASPFPYWVMLCVILAHLLLDGLGIFSLLRTPVAEGSEHLREFTLYTSLGSDIGFLVIYATFSLAVTQWWLERRRISGLPGYAPAGIGFLSLVLGAAWGLAAVFLGLHIAHAFVGTAGILLARTISVLIGYVVGPLLLILSIWLAFRLLRRREKPAAGSVELRGRSLLIFTLFAWSWVMLVLALTMPTAGAYFMSQDIDPNLLHLGPYAGSFGLVLPAFFGALLGLPRSVPVTRPVRLWLAAALAMVICVVMMVAITFAVARIAMVFGEAVEPTMGLCAIVTLAWLIVSTPLCWLLVKALARQPLPPEPYRQADAGLLDVVS